MEQKKQAFDDLLLRYSDEADAMGYQSVHYGQNAQEIDRLTAQYELWNAAKEAGIELGDRITEHFDLVPVALVAGGFSSNGLEICRLPRQTAPVSSKRLALRWRSTKLNSPA